MSSAWWTAGCLSSATAVALGAFGAHGLKQRISDPVSYMYLSSSTLN